MADKEASIAAKIDEDDAQQGTPVVDIDQLKQKLPEMIVAAEFNSKLEAAKLAYPENKLRQRHQVSASLKDNFSSTLANISLRNIELSAVCRIFSTIETTAKQQIASATGAFNSGSSPQERATAQGILDTITELKVICESGPTIAKKVMNSFVTNAKGALEANLRGPIEAAVKAQLQVSYDEAIRAKDNTINELKSQVAGLEKQLFQANTKLESYSGDSQKVDASVELSKKLEVAEERRAALSEENHQQALEIARLKAALEKAQELNEEKIRSKNREIELKDQHAEETRKYAAEILERVSTMPSFGGSMRPSATGLIASQQASGMLAPEFKVKPHPELEKAFTEPRAIALTFLGNKLSKGAMQFKQYYQMIRDNKEIPMAEMSFDALSPILESSDKGLVAVLKKETAQSLQHFINVTNAKARGGPVAYMNEKIALFENSLQLGSQPTRKVG